MLHILRNKKHKFANQVRRLTTKPSISPKPKVSCLDLHNSGLSAVERLCLEEALLRHDPLERSWVIVGMHEPTHHTYLRIPKDEDATRNDSCIIIMGIGGKPEQLLDVEKVKNDDVLTIKRFSGGGTVVVDHSSLWTTFIGRTQHFPHVSPFPRSIMEWSATDIFDRVFERMKVDASEGQQRRSLVMDTKSCGLSQDNGETLEYDSKKSSGLPSLRGVDFSLRENDYVLGERKMGGNAQSITGDSWMHHTSFLWDYEDENMQYLTLPNKRPDYRGDRSHDDFLVKLKTIYGNSGDERSSKHAFLNHVKSVSCDAFDLEEVSFADALSVVDDLGGMQAWFDGKCRTKIIDL